MSTSTASTQPLRVSIIGSGNWGTAVAKIVAENTATHAQFAPKVKMWMHEEIVRYEGKDQKLTEVFNKTHQNVKYLKGITCPRNLIATDDIADVAATSDIFIMVVPHQFVVNICRQMKPHILKSALALSCIKGVSVSVDGITIFAVKIQEILGIYCGALSGANIANEVAQEKFSETTIAFHPTDDNAGPQRDSRIDTECMRQLFARPYFRIGLIDDVAGVSLTGALKNVVAVAAGLADGLGYGDNGKAAIMRIGLSEMLKFAQFFFPTVQGPTFTEHSCGVADLITSCAGGRNRLCAMEFVKTGKTMDEVERDLLGGQKLQGAATAKEVHELLHHRGEENKFPLFTAVYRIVYERVPPSRLWLMLDP